MIGDHTACTVCGIGRVGIVKITIAMVALLLCCTYIAINHYLSDIDVNRYKNIKEVHKDRAIERGWIPAILPESAYDITETHNLDTNRLYGRFHYLQKDEVSLLQYLQSIEETNNTYIWQDFLFRLDTTNNIVQYYNTPLAQ